MVFRKAINAQLDVWNDVETREVCRLCGASWASSGERRRGQAGHPVRSWDDWRAVFRVGEAGAARIRIADTTLHEAAVSASQEEE